MSELRAARERAGLTLAQVQERTRISTKWLDALERGDTASFPPGPFLAGYTKQYRSFLALPEAVAVAATARPAPVVMSAPSGPARPAVGGDAEPDPVQDVRRGDEHTITLTNPVARLRRVGRMGALGAAAAALLLGALWFAGRGVPVEVDGVDIAPDQVLLVTSDSGVRARVVADGREVFGAALPTGRQVRFAAHDRLTIDLDAIEGVSLVYNGRTLKPLGAQSRARRLVFIDDHGG
ncbi:MAG: helix-turn-helix domain-containing protein [Myxococcales bacterium]|nr:helix-turn-helix domain-containing protein [Myxococcales bacterium]